VALLDGGEELMTTSEIKQAILDREPVYCSTCLKVCEPVKVADMEVYADPWFVSSCHRDDILSAQEAGQEAIRRLHMKDRPRSDLGQFAWDIGEIMMRRPRG